MNRFVILSLPILIALAACNSEKQPKKDAINPDSTVCFVLKRFNLLYPENINPDSNSFIFYGNRTFDTSFLLQIKKQGAEVNGIYYEVLPNYHQSMVHQLKSDRHLFFEGYSFMCDSAKWEMIKKRANAIPPTDTSAKNNFGMRDGESYALFFNHEIKKSDWKNAEGYENFYKFLKDSLLGELIQNRKPDMYKVK